MNTPTKHKDTDALHPKFGVQAKLTVWSPLRTMRRRAVRYVVAVCLLLALAISPPFVFLVLQQPPVAHTVEVDFWPIHPALREGRTLQVAFLSFTGPCIAESELLRAITRRSGLLNDVEYGDVDVLHCHDGNRVNGDARALYEASTSIAGAAGGFSCVTLPRSAYVSRVPHVQGPCIALKSHDLNLMNARVRLTFFEDFETLSAARWTPVVDPRIIKRVNLTPDIAPLQFLPCDARSPVLHANRCAKLATATYGALQGTFSEPWIPKEVVIQYQVRLVHQLRPAREGGPGQVRLIQALSTTNDTALPGTIEFTADWNRVGRTSADPPVGE